MIRLRMLRAKDCGLGSTAICGSEVGWGIAKCGTRLGAHLEAARGVLGARNRAQRSFCEGAALECT
jgi:hypothetical protein